MRYKIDNSLENFNPGQLGVYNSYDITEYQIQLSNMHNILLVFIADEAFRNLLRMREDQINGLYDDRDEVHAAALQNFFRYIQRDKVHL